MTKRATQFAINLSTQFEELQNLVSARFLAEGNSTSDANSISQGYIQSLMIDMIAHRFSQKEVLATIQVRKETQREKIHEARMKKVDEFNSELL